LVTGGVGSIGLEIAGYLAAHGARHLVLTSRRGPSDAAQQRIDALSEQHGCEFRVIAADVADAHGVASLEAIPVTTAQRSTDRGETLTNNPATRRCRWTITSGWSSQPARC